MNLSYDLHIHTALSPCADDDMTPNNIVNMAALAGLDVIAITDHNETGNARACMEAAVQNELDLVVLPGMELETAEEIHVVCLFDDIGAAERFGAFVEGHAARVPNRPDIFGDQLYMDKDDNITGRREHLLLTATRLSIEEAFAAVRAHGGVAYPAHIDRESNGILNALGMVPPEINAGLLEISRRADAPKFWAGNARLLGGAAAYVVSSDAHNLAAISEPDRAIQAEEKTAAAALGALRAMAAK